MSLRLAQVVKLAADHRTCNIVMADTGQRFAAVQVCSSDLSSDHGSVALADVEPPPTEAVAGGIGQKPRNYIAVVGFLGVSPHDRPIVMGFLHPAHGQMVFVQGQEDRQVYRAPGGTYWTVAPNGDFEIFHPSGAMFRIGSNTVHEDLTPLSAGPWKLPERDPVPITTLNPGYSKIRLPNGAMTEHNDQAMTFDSNTIITLSIAGTPVVIVQDNSVTIDAAVTINGTLEVTDSITTPTLHGTADRALTDDD